MDKSNQARTMIILLFALNFLSYIDRSAMAYAIPVITSSLRINSYLIGLILGSFGIGYFITTFLGGVFVDKYGSKRVLLLSTLIWTCSMGLTGLATGFYSLYLARFGLGAGEGPSFPAVARTVSDWIPLRSRCQALANSLFAVPLSLAIGAPVVTFLITYLGWRLMFLVLAVLVLLWWPFCYLFFLDKSKDNKVAKATLLTSTKEDKYYFFKNKTLLSNAWGFFVYGYSMFFFLTWLPDFLASTYHLSVKQIGLFSILPWILATLFLWLGGYLSDLLYNKTKSLRYARSYLILAGQLFTLLSLLVILTFKDLTVILIAISFAVAFNLSNNTPFYAINMDVSAKRAGTSLGFMNSMFAIAGFLAPTITGAAVQLSGNFYTAFLLMGLLTLSAIISILLFHHPDKALSKA
ncbi:major facilitator family transporter [Legionella busanensis]|uniref:Major facilitator family transporter n=1 Tax=Legionella busanensis TaxID=190655 RepID=A0A378JJR4_9GAMM|nr:MFS transporter [Legionella busanensis]STX51465.1 major facilitator family transporter [Legionella busanensis]